MSVRKRVWVTRRGETKEAWVANYSDGQGVRRIKTFGRKKDADAFHSTAQVDVAKGTHVPDSTSVTVAEAGQHWLASGRAAGLERTSLDQRDQHLRLHIAPFLGRVKLSRLTVPAVRAFADKLAEQGRSPVMIRRVLTSLGGLISDAQERGLVSHNAVRELARGRRRTGSERHRRPLEVGRDIPSPAEVRALLAAARPRWRPFLMAAVFTGLRASELRGLRWQDLDLDKAELTVCQRADRRRAIGSPKSAASRRTVPLPPPLVAELKAWKLRCPRQKDKPLHYVFPTVEGQVLDINNTPKRSLWPALMAAGITQPVLDKGGQPMRDKEGKPVVEPRYKGLHALRHFYASWLINRKADGGLELPAKVVQARLGHASITMTLDRYGHLFPHGDDHAVELDTAARALIG